MEKLFERQRLTEAVPRGRVSGDTSVVWPRLLSGRVETLLGMTVPPRSDICAVFLSWNGLQ